MFAFLCSSQSGPFLNFSSQNSSLLSDYGIQSIILEPSVMNFKQSSLNNKILCCQFEAIVCMILLLLSSISCSLICATFRLIINRDVEQDFWKNKKQLELAETKTVRNLGATYTQQAWNNLVRFGKFVEQSELLMRTNLIMFISKTNICRKINVC